MKYRLYIGLAALALMTAGLVVQRVWLAVDESKPQHDVGPTGPVSLTDSGWQSVPEFLSGATVLGNDNPTSPLLRHVAQHDGVLLLAASWTYDGDRSANEVWTPQCQTLAQLASDGWAPIGKMLDSQGDRYYIFRRNVHAGEMLKVQTRLKTPGYFIEVPEADVAAVMAAEPLAGENRKTLLDVGLPSATSDAPQPAVGPEVLALDSPEPDKPFGKYSRLGLLLREIVRQGVSLAGREELGISTRDNSLRELWPASDDSGREPLEVVAVSQPYNELLLGIFRRHDGHWEALYDDHIRFPGDNLYERVTTALEARSRGEIVAALKHAGFGGAGPVGSREQATIPADIEELAQELNVPAQYGVVRYLHTEIRKHGESPELLGLLSRSYALLGVLTDHLWSPASKVFQARALLYAERAVNRWPQSALALYSRAYVRALVGLHRTALEDLTAAAKIIKQSGQEPPSWAVPIEPYCRFDAEALDAAAQTQSQRGFVRLLQLLTAEFSDSARSMMAASKALFDESRGCLRAIDCAADVKQLGFYRYVAALGPAAAQKELLSQVRKVPNLPEPASKLIDDFQSQSGMLSRLLGAKPPDEMATRLKVIAALREADGTNKESPEPSWQVLAELLEDIDFVHAWRQVDVAACRLGVPADGVLDEIEPQVEHHPYRNFLEIFRSDPIRAQQARDELLAKLEIGLMSRVEDPLVQRLHKADPQWGKEHFPFGLYWDDSVASDLVVTVHNASEPQRTAARLRDVSPYMPFGVVVGLMYDLDGLRKKKEELEKKYAKDGYVLGTLAQCYAIENHPDDAIRCYEASIKLDPAESVYLSLADLYLKKDDEEHWLETLEDYLKTEDYGLGHAGIQVKIADHFIEKGDWARARPYADAAAETWAEWALLKAGQCAEAVQDWPAAERWYAAVSQRYENNSWAWYEFCRRTGRGNPALALRIALPTIHRSEQHGTPDEKFRAAVEHLLDKQPQEAAGIFEAVYGAQPTPVTGLHALLAFDESGDTKSRDRILEAMHGRCAEDLSGQQSKLAELAELIRNSRQDGVLAAVDHGALNDLVSQTAQSERAVLLFLIGWYLDRAGEKADSIVYWKRCLQERFTDPCNCTRTLAGAALVDHGGAPESKPPEKPKSRDGDSNKLPGADVRSI
jgi:tetratricopeptide (TPR) repeat protein